MRKAGNTSAGGLDEADEQPASSAPVVGRRSFVGGTIVAAGILAVVGEQRAAAQQLKVTVAKAAQKMPPGKLPQSVGGFLRMA